MRVLHLLASADRRGAEVFAVDLAAALDDLGHTSDLVALSPAGAAGSGLPVDVVPALGSIGALRSLRARARGADVVLGHGSRGLVAGTLATLGTRTPFVYRSIGDPTHWGASRSRRLRVGLQLRRAAAVTALWDGAAAAIVAQYRVPAEKVHVVPNAADAHRFAPADRSEQAAARASLGCPPDAPVLLALGALAPEKRVDLAIQVVASSPDQHLLIAGDGPLRAQIEAQAAQLLPGRHQVLGSVADVRPMLAAADALLLLSATEGQPGAAIEAGLCGLPVVATDVGGVASVVVDGQTGRLVPADAGPDAIAGVISEALGDRDALGRAAHERCDAEFSLSTVARRFAEVLDAVVARP